MARPILTNVLVLVGAILYNVIFWQEKMGVNTLIFTLFLLGSLYFLNKEAFQTRSVQITAGGTLLLSLMVVWHNSLIAKTIYTLSFMVCIGLVQRREIRFLLLAFMVFLSNVFETPIHILNNLKSLPILRGGHGIAKSLKLIFISVLILPVFYILYYFANPKFSELSDKFWGHVFEWLNFDWNLSRVFFFLGGLMLVGTALWKHTRDYFAQQDNAYAMELDEATYNDEEQQLRLFDMDEKTTYMSATILVALLNIMLFFNNILDFTYVWLSNKVDKTAAELKQYVHEGTYFLIAGIVLAIVVIMYLFKGRVNFLENNKILRGLSYAWIGQNAFLALSVGMRNWEYIDHYGLAYKRIGVVVFLILVLYGLYLMYVKITEKRTLFHFLTKGSWVIYAVMVAACCINWDVFITRYNLTTDTKSHSIDVPFLVRTVSDKNLYLLYENRAKLIEKMPNKPFEQEFYWDLNIPNFANDSLKISYLDRLLEEKKYNFLQEQKFYTAFSWNFADAKNISFFKK